LDPERRSHLVRRIAALPQTFITTTTPDDLDPALRRIATGWEVRPAFGGGGSELRRAGDPGA
jgi:recombinational DNA repair ATPase RecF